MPRPCSICAHPKRAVIDVSIVAGESHRLLAARHELSADSISRHARSHIPATLAKAQNAAEVAQADSLMEKLAKLERLAEELGKEARNEGDIRTAFQDVRERVRIAELLAKLGGELADGGTTVNVGISPSEWAGVRARIARALEPFPEAKQAVADALAGVLP